MDFLTIIEVSLILMLNFPGAKGLGCKTCIKLSVKDEIDLTFLGIPSNNLSVATEPNCHVMGSCSSISEPGKVSKCATYQGAVTLTFTPQAYLTSYEINAGLVFRRCEKAPGDVPDRCTPYSTDTDNTPNFLNDALNVLEKIHPISRNYQN